MKPLFFNCPACGVPVEAKADYIARGLKCPACNTGFAPVEIPRRSWRRIRPGESFNWSVSVMALVIVFIALLVNFWAGAVLAIIALLAVIAAKLAELSKKRR